MDAVVSIQIPSTARYLTLKYTYAGRWMSNNHGTVVQKSKKGVFQQWDGSRDEMTIM